MTRWIDSRSGLKGPVQRSAARVPTKIVVGVEPWRCNDARETRLRLITALTTGVRAISAVESKPTIQTVTSASRAAMTTRREGPD